MGSPAEVPQWVNLCTKTVTAGQSACCDDYRVSGPVVGEQSRVLRAAETSQTVLYDAMQICFALKMPLPFVDTLPCSSLTVWLTETKLVCCVGSMPVG